MLYSWIEHVAKDRPMPNVPDAALFALPERYDFQFISDDTMKNRNFELACQSPDPEKWDECANEDCTRYVSTSENECEKIHA